MLWLVLILLLVGVVLAGFLWIGSLFLQGYIYNEPAEGLPWRAAAAGGALMVFLAVWCLLDYRLAAPGAEELPLDTLWNFSATEYYPAKPFTQFWSVKNGQEILYTRRQSGQYQTQYFDGNNQPWSRESNGLVEALILDENGQKVRFKLDLPGGRFKPNEPAVYREEGGRRVLKDTDVNQGALQFTRFRTGLYLANVVLNLLFLVLWFACLWLLLRFQWSHALGLALALWLGVSLIALPPLFSATKNAVAQKPVRTETPAAALRSASACV